MSEEQKIFAGKLFSPGDAQLRAIKLKCHNLCTKYNQTMEDETELRSQILSEIFGELGEDSRVQGPIYIHYGTHTKIGKRMFANFNFTIQDDTHVTIGDDCNFGPGVTIVTPVHPLIAEERKAIVMPDGSKKHMCYAQPVTIGSNCWFGASVTICPGVTIGDNCVIGAGSVVTRDIPDNSLAVGVPCRVLRQIDESDSVMNIPGLLDYSDL